MTIGCVPHYLLIFYGESHLTATVDLLKLDTHLVDKYSANMCLNEICFHTSVRNTLQKVSLVYDEYNYLINNEVSNLSKYTVIILASPT